MCTNLLTQTFFNLIVYPYFTYYKSCVFLVLQNYPPVDEDYVRSFLAVIGALSESKVKLDNRSRKRDILV